MTRDELDNLPDRLSDTKYEVGKYYKIKDPVVHRKGYAFLCRPVRGSVKGVYLALVKVVKEK
jgi:hypothetical protein